MANIFKELLKETFNKTKNNILNSIQTIFTKKDINLDELEEVLIKNDFGAEFTEEIIFELKKKNNISKSEDLIKSLKEILLNKLNFYDNQSKHENNKLTIIQIIGVNGSGKTTTIGKLVNYYKLKGKNIIVASCDTFRAAANEQLKRWALTSDVRIIEDFSKDPAAVAFEAIKTAQNEKFDLLFIDTAGRLHTNKNLMLELQKISNIVEKNVNENVKSYNWLIVDGNSGQNANNQYNEFSKYVRIDGIIITKLDGTSKGGSVFQISVNNKIPILFLGVGESKENIVEFNAEEYIDSILE
ncbi:MAG: signal recognition particle-docking protein FtsY [Melioribacteraceae bacterium]|nr:signal recognition particle-docking protein FtsY [Melioribacteraceae bacterium]